MESEDDTLGMPYADPLLYTWDAMVFLVPALLAKVGIKGKNAYNVNNKPTWWPEQLRFCSPNSSTAGNFSH
ncbi:Hypothetical predicted protein [Mytilus galloprovincialis]|uniref:Uncharacterized protein n=1 Tax=Mytilus galloprovincialis TaxID=29158 RepID=A0A8B6EWF0_MYTGA|nr:Hypothetical predicted protein [Mytilus galloprovincialis]